MSDWRKRLQEQAKTPVQRETEKKLEQQALELATEEALADGVAVILKAFIEAVPILKHRVQYGLDGAGNHCTLAMPQTQNSIKAEIKGTTIVVTMDGGHAFKDRPCGFEWNPYQGNFTMARHGTGPSVDIDEIVGGIIEEWAKKHGLLSG